MCQFFLLNNLLTDVNTFLRSESSIPSCSQCSDVAAVSQEHFLFQAALPFGRNSSWAVSHPVMLPLPRTEAPQGFGKWVLSCPTWLPHSHREKRPANGFGGNSMIQQQEQERTSALKLDHDTVCHPGCQITNLMPPWAIYFISYVSLFG